MFNRKMELRDFVLLLIYGIITSEIPLQTETVLHSLSDFDQGLKPFFPTDKIDTALYCDTVRCIAISCGAQTNKKKQGENLYS